MTWDEVKDLSRKKARREAMKRMLSASINRRKAAQEAGDERMVMHERIQEAQLTTFITRINDEIFELGKKLGVDPDTGEVSE